MVPYSCKKVATVEETSNNPQGDIELLVMYALVLGWSRLATAPKPRAQRQRAWSEMWAPAASWRQEPQLPLKQNWRLNHCEACFYPRRRKIQKSQSVYSCLPSLVMSLCRNGLGLVLTPNVIQAVRGRFGPFARAAAPTPGPAWAAQLPEPHWKILL